MPKLIVRLSDISKCNKNYYVDLEPYIKSKIIEKAISITNQQTLKELAKILQIPVTRIYDAKTRGSFSLALLSEISNFLVKNRYKEFSLNNLEKNLLFISGRGNSNKLYKPKFPFNFITKEGIRIISRMYHDGGIRNSREPHYGNKYRDRVENLCFDVCSLLGKINIKIQREEHKNVIWYKTYLPRFIGDILEMVGCHRGKKIYDDPFPPDWIKELNSDLLSEYVRIAMDDEGTVGNSYLRLKIAVDITKKLRKNELNILKSLNDKDKLVYIRRLSKKRFFIPHILDFNKQLLEKIGIKVNEPRIDSVYTNKLGDNIRVKYTITITGRENILNYSKKVGFDLRHKAIKLRNLTQEMGA